MTELLYILCTFKAGALSIDTTECFALPKQFFTILAINLRILDFKNAMIIFRGMWIFDQRIIIARIPNVPTLPLTPKIEFALYL